MSKRICVVGAGRWGRNHAAALRELGHLAGIVETDAATRADMQRLYSGVSVIADLDEALRIGFDGFTVATPAETHAGIARRIIEHGRPVLVEKPLATTSADARRLVAVAGKRGVLLMVGHVLLFHPAIRKIKELIATGKIGHLQYLYSNRLNLGTVRTEENILWSFAPHDLSVFQYLIESEPEQVVSHGAVFLQKPHIHDSTLTILRYPRNIVGHIFVSWLHPFKEHRLVVIGDRGMLSFEDSPDRKELCYYEKGIDWVEGRPVPREGPTSIVDFDRRAPLTEELRYFVEHLDGRRVEIADGSSAVGVLEILERATRSMLGEAGMSGAIDKPYFVHPSSFVDAGVEIGEGTKIWHFTHVQTGARIGRNCTIGQNVNVGPRARIGNHVRIQNNVSVYEGVELEDYVFCGPSVVFTNIRDPRSKYPQMARGRCMSTLVREGATLGANATIVCGHAIGRHAFIAAGAVVTRDVPDYALMVGVPARQRGWVCECGERLGDIDREAVCHRCQRRFRLREGCLRPES